MPWGWALVAVLLLFTCGCGSDRGATPAGQRGGGKDAAGENQAKKHNKPEFEFLALTTRPTDYAITVPHVKPGHWIEASQKLIANYNDFSGELEVGPILLPGVPFALEMSRPAVLASSQIKSLPLTIYAPVDQNKYSYHIQLRNSATGNVPLKSLNPVVRLAPHQYFFTVLTPEPDRFGFLRDLDSVVPPTGLILPQGDEANYRIMTPAVTNRVLLSTHLLTSTAVAYVLWDDVDPVVLTAEQETALLDWLHWGGQLIVNGPQTLDSLKNSFLAPYLPADGDGVVKLPFARVNQALNDEWTTGPIRLAAEEDWPAQQLRPREDSHVLLYIGEMPAVVERRVGRGRIVTTAFSLAHRELIVWPDFDAFFNATILRRGPRVFGYDEVGMLSVRWAGKRPSIGIHESDAAAYSRTFDAAKNSQLWFFSRDAPRSRGSIPQLLDERDARRGNVLWAENGRRRFGYLNGSSGVGGWNSWNAVTQHVRDSLIAAAGIDVPRASFVLWLLAAYLFVLVPVNWAIFRAVGRIEWAWIAAPIITILFSVVVVKLARLNIGFARARTEIAIVELHGGYNRAHVTRYTALYTSLGTNYALAFEDRGALARPFPLGREMFAGQHRSVLRLRRGSETDLTGFSVASNSLGILHTESMFTCEGGLQLNDIGSAWRIENHTGLHLRDVGIIAPKRFGWIDELAGNDTVTVSCQPYDRKPSNVFPLMKYRLTAKKTDENLADGLDVLKLIHLAESEGIQAEELRLVAVLDEALPGLSVTPRSDQDRRAMLVVAHLKFKPLDDPTLDIVSRVQAESKQKQLPEFEIDND